MNYLWFFQFCLSFGNLCIYRDVSSAFCNFICCNIHFNNLKNFHFCSSNQRKNFVTFYDGNVINDF